MIFRESTKEDLEYIKNHSINTRVDRTEVECTNYVYTLEHEGVILMVGGFQIITPTTAWCWIDLGDEFGKHITTGYRTIKEWISLFVKNHNIKRLQAFIRIDFVEAIRMMRHLGFERESIMKNFFGDEDAYMYRKII